MTVPLVAHLPLLLTHARALWLRPHYQFFPLVLLGAGILAWQRLRGCGPLRPGRLILSVPLLLGACLLFAVPPRLVFSKTPSRVKNFRSLAAVSWLVSIVAAALRHESGHDLPGPW